jgi:hypothetical protein
MQTIQNSLRLKMSIRRFFDFIHVMLSKITIVCLALFKPKQISQY